jgi:hypothetical protein
MTGMIVMFAGGAVGYKSKFQPVITHSSTEAEFVAACDTAKHILFYRSLLAELHGQFTATNPSHKTHGDKNFCLTRLGRTRYDHPKTRQHQ